MKRALVAFAALCLFVTLAVESDARRPRPRWSRGAPAVLGAGGPAPSADIITGYTWDLSYYANDLSGSSWPSRDGSLTLTAYATVADTGISTSNFTSAALPAELVDEAVNPGATPHAGYHSAVNSYTWTTGDFHCRAIIERIVDEGTNWYLWRFLDSSSYYVGWKGGAGTEVVPQYRAIGIFDHAAVDWGAVPVATLADWSIDIDGGAGGETKSIIQINGVESTADDTDSTVQAGGTGALGLMGTEIGQLSPDTNWIFFGCRFGELLTLSEHQADAEALGVYVP